jgi:enterochelin esterase-like enzyme
VAQARIPAGTLCPPELIPSEKLGYEVAVRTYVPASLRAVAAPLPILYVTDGSDYWSDDMGSLKTTLDNLVGEGRIAPLVAVFVDPWDPKHEVNRRQSEFLPNQAAPERPIEACPFCEFLVDELGPIVEGRFSIDSERRGILGTSFGGFNAAFMAARYPSRFRLVGIQSPAIDRQPWLIGAIARADGVPQRVAIDVGLQEEWAIPGARDLRDAFAARGALVRYDELPADHSWAHWRVAVVPMLEFLYGPR